MAIYTTTWRREPCDGPRKRQFTLAFRGSGDYTSTIERSSAKVASPPGCSSEARPVPLQRRSRIHTPWVRNPDHRRASPPRSFPNCARRCRRTARPRDRSPLRKRAADAVSGSPSPALSFPGSASERNVLRALPGASARSRSARHTGSSGHCPAHRPTVIPYRQSRADSVFRGGASEQDAITSSARACGRRCRRETPRLRPVRRFRFCVARRRDNGRNLRRQAPSIRSRM